MRAVAAHLNTTQSDSGFGSIIADRCRDFRRRNFSTSVQAMPHGPDDSHRAPYQSLGHLCEQLGVVYKSLFKLDKKDMSRSDLGETLLYRADTKYTLWLYHRQTSLLRTVTVGLAQASTPISGLASGDR